MVDPNDVETPQGVMLGDIVQPLPRAPSSAIVRHEVLQKIDIQEETVASVWSGWSGGSHACRCPTSRWTT